MTGLYFYKLVSPYPEDVTKDCKLTVNEIDHNFLTLKDEDVKDFTVDYEHGFITLERNNGDKLKADISHFTKDMSVCYDRLNGVIKFNHDGIVDVIDGLITTDNVTKALETHIVVDATLRGSGASGSPLGIAPTEKTSAFKAVTKVINKMKGECLPHSSLVIKGDRYLTYETKDEFGFLYTYKSARQFATDAQGGWRVPTKADWDSMLNAIEPCAEDRNHDIASCNIMLGKLAGKYLKSNDIWTNCPTPCGGTICDSNCGCCTPNCNTCPNDDVFDNIDCGQDVPQCKPITPEGVDAYGMRILPTGYGDGCRMTDYATRRTRFWTSTSINISDVYTKRFDYDKAGVVQIAENPNALSSLRLVKEYDGTNYYGVENINGINYPTILMPSTNAKFGFMIWMGSNVASMQNKYCPVTPPISESMSTATKVYMINEWNGFDWDRKELCNGDSLVIVNGPDGSDNEEFRLVDGVLVNIKKSIIIDVEHKYDHAIEELDGRVTVIEGEVTDLKNSVSNLNTALNNEIDRSTKEDARLEQKINDEIAAREEANVTLTEMIQNEINRSTQEDEKLNSKIDDEISRATAAEEKNASDIASEIDRATKAETELNAKIDKEITDRTEGFDALSKQISDEIKSRQDADKTITDNLNAEVLRSTTEDERISGRLINNQSTFSCANGVLTLVTDDADNNIQIQLDSNYGTF